MTVGKVAKQTKAR